MSSSINTACKSHKVHGALVAGVFICLAMVAVAQEAPLHVPSNAVAGQAASIATTGGGSATFYLVGPSISFKQDVELGQNIDLTAKELQTSGDYVAVLCTGTCSSARFFVVPGKAAALTFLVHPSRACGRRRRQVRLLRRDRGCKIANPLACLLSFVPRFFFPVPLRRPPHHNRLNPSSSRSPSTTVTPTTSPPRLASSSTACTLRFIFRAASSGALAT